MVTIDLNNVSIRNANEILRGYGSTHQDVEILNPDARHYIGVGLINPIKVIVRGSAGYYCGGLCDGPGFFIEGNASWGVGDNLFQGSVVVNGNASAVAGEGLRGGEIVVKGNLGSRSGQVMKKGTLCSARNANFMAGYMMYGGRMIILGDSGERVGEDMMGGAIYIGGRIESLGSDAMLTDTSSDEIDSVREFLDRYKIRFKGTLKKVVCAGKLLKYAKSEPRLRRQPFYIFSGGRQDYWNQKVTEDIRIKSITGRYRIRGYGASRHLPHFPDIAFKIDPSAAGKDPDAVAKVNLRTYFGERSGGRAFDLSMPVMIAPMSFGALSAEMKTAIAIASRLSGISENSGEGGMLSIERAQARLMIAQCLAGRLGWNIHDMKRADGVEIYISQGAKPGLGGQLMAEKLTEELAAVRGIPAGMDLRSPSRHPDILGGDDLIMKVAEFREATGGRVPISIKLGAGRIRDDIKIAFKDGLDFIELDGLQGGTGAAPDEVLEYVGLPTIAGLEEALRGLEEIEAAGKLPIVLMGGIRDGVDALKAIALGATAVGMGTAVLVAGGCISCMQCSVGSCVIGAATQNPELTGRIEIEKKARQIHNFLEAVRWQMAAIIRALGYSDVRQVSRKDLVALTPEAAEMLHLPYEPGYREKLRLQIDKQETDDAKGSIYVDTGNEWVHDEYHDPVYIPTPCQEGCPVGTDIPSYIGLIGRGEYEKAFEVLSANNPFSFVCGRICSKPCEDVCRRGNSDQAVTIRDLKRFVSDQVGKNYSLPPTQVTLKPNVGIVGGGPAGMTAAQDLAEAGYEVHIYERMDRLGGMMAAGIPPFRCPRSFLEDDISRMLKHCPGIKVHLNCVLGRDVTLRQLKERHGAVLLSIGLWKDKKLNIPDEREVMSGLYGINFLMDINNGKNIRLKGKVIVIGGGNVAIDMARTAGRAGAENVQLFFLETRDSMPAWEHEVREAVAEGILFNPSWGPKRILHKNGKVTGVEFMRCVSVFDDKGMFDPRFDPGSTQTVDTGSILVGIGLTVDDPGLSAAGLIGGGLVKAEVDTMRTADPKVFAAGDCGFGASSVVNAMHLGHRAAYYVKAFLEGKDGPPPYRTPFNSRSVLVTQDPNWEKMPREEQVFLGLGDTPSVFSECGLTYDLETAKRQATRCLRCDTETGSAGYSRRTREHIHAMAKTGVNEIDKQQRILSARLRPRDNPFPPGRSAHLDDVVFMSAALTRLVIDPYREACSMGTKIGESLELELPFFFTGFDGAPPEVRQALFRSLKAGGCAYIGFQPPGEGVRWLQLLVDGDSEPHPEAGGLVYVMGNKFRAVKPERLYKGQLIGLAAAAPALAEAIPYALDNSFDFMLLNGTGNIADPWVELRQAPDLTVIRDAIKILRSLNMEEELSLLYYGGLRTGTDVAKVLAMNCNAGVFSAAMGIALGGVIENDRLQFSGKLSIEDLSAAGENWIKAASQEAAIIGRCTGKTNVHNLEPEDMRAITLSTSKDLGILLASGRGAREYF